MLSRVGQRVKHQGAVRLEKTSGSAVTRARELGADKFKQGDRVVTTSKTNRILFDKKGKVKRASKLHVDVELLEGLLPGCLPVLEDHSSIDSTTNIRMSPPVGRQPQRH